MPNSIYTAARLKLQQQNMETLGNVMQMAKEETRQVLTVARTFSFSETGSYLRATIPAVLDKWGNVSAVTAVDYFDETRDLWTASRYGDLDRLRELAKGRGKGGRSTRAALQGQLKKADKYAAALPVFDVVGKSEAVIGFGMALAAQGFPPAEVSTRVENMMTRMVGAFNRDTVLYNAGLDSFVVGVQRVAEPNACPFCSMMAFSSYRSAGPNLDVRVTDYAIDFHDNCRCTIDTLYEGDSPIRPDYYDKYEQEYFEYGSVGFKDGVKDIRTARREAAKASD